MEIMSGNEVLNFSCNLTEEDARKLGNKIPFDEMDEDSDPRTGTSLSGKEEQGAIAIDLNIIYDTEKIGNPAYFVCHFDGDNWVSDGYLEDFGFDQPDMDFIRFAEPGWKYRLCEDMLSAYQYFA